MLILSSQVCTALGERVRYVGNYRSCLVTNTIFSDRVLKDRIPEEDLEGKTMTPSMEFICLGFTGFAQALGFE